MSVDSTRSITQRLDALEARVAHLEGYVEHMLRPTEVGLVSWGCERTDASQFALRPQDREALSALAALQDAAAQR